MWFEQLTGFKEESPENVKKNIEINGSEFVSLVNSQRFSFGKLEVPTLSELKNQSKNIIEYTGKIQVTEIVADVQKLHAQIENSNALFQAASQFNLLEMVNRCVTPEQGIDRYEFDYTQGPACAISCGAGTIYRNYFAEVNGQIGQTANNQINCLDLIGKELGNDELNLWEMQNGYALANQNGLLAINKKITQLTLIALSVAALSSCGDEDASSQDLLSDFEFADSVQSQVVVSEEIIEEMIHSIPSPIEMTTLIIESGAPFDEKLLNDPDRVDNYQTAHARAINLGVFGTELGYLNIYQKTLSSVDYLTAVRSLAKPR